MRSTLALTVCVLCVPALPAGAQQRAPQATVNHIRAGSANVLRPGTTLARRFSPAAALSANLLAQNGSTAHGSITMEARQLQGAEALDVEGTAPANAPVTITLLAIFSSDVPTVVVSRNDVVTDVNGHFGAVIPIASAFERGTVLKVLATSLPEAGSASAQIVTDAPNAGVSVPLEQPPHDAR